MTKENSLSVRQEYMDIFRGFGIILMVMGHVNFGSRFDFFIHAFHMPMFFVISGFFFPSAMDVTLSNFVRKKARTLLFPYIVFGLCHYLINLLLYPEKGIDPLMHLLFVNTTNMPIAGALWFLTALFLTECFYFLINRYISNEVIKHIIIIGIAVLGNCINEILTFTLPYAMGTAMVGVGLFHIGFLMRKCEHSRFMNHILNMPILEWLVCAVVTVLLIFHGGYVNMRLNTYEPILPFWINAILAVIIGINCSKYVYRFMCHTYLCQCLCSIGRNSIIYLCLNELSILIVVQYFPHLFKSWLPAQIYTFCLSLIILQLCRLLFTKTKLKVFLGR